MPARSLLLVSALAFVASCWREPPTAGARANTQEEVVARFKGGTITRQELQHEAGRLPESLRERFETPVGRRELAYSLVDKRLMVQEARERGLAEDPEVRRQVRELEERLIVQALLRAEERAAGAPQEGELRAYFEANRESFRQPERVRLARVLAAVPPGASSPERARAKARAEEFARRLKAGESLSRVQMAGDGPERATGGEMGLVARGDLRDEAAEAVVFGLARPQQVTPVLQTADGFAVFQLLERRESRMPSFEEVRGEVEGRVAPSRQRKVFDALRAKLRGEADIQIEVASRP